MADKGSTDRIDLKFLFAQALVRSNASIDI